MQTEETEEVRFENHYKFTLSMRCRVHWKLSPLTRWLGLIELAFGAYQILPWNNPNGYNTSSGLTIITIGVLTLVYPFLGALLANRNYRKLMNGELPLTEVRYSDSEICATAQRNQSHILYSQIRGVRSTGDLWLLMVGRSIAVIVNKSGFTVGKPADFPNFIRSKCPGLKGTFN